MKKAQVGSKVELIKEMRKEMKIKAEDIRNKTKLHKQLVDELNKLPKSVNRQKYIKRIMDVLRSLEKQDDVIQDVLKSVRQVQKDINLASQAKVRSFGVADEVIYQSAIHENQKIPVEEQFGIPAYKNIVALRDGFAKLIQIVEDTGKTKNEIKDIEAKIETEKQKNTAENMKQLLEDLKAVKVENQQIKNKIKKYQG